MLSAGIVIRPAMCYPVKNGMQLPMAAPYHRWNELHVMIRSDQSSGLSRSLWDRAFFRRFPPYVWACLAVVFAVQMATFTGTRVFLPYLPVHDLTTDLDRAIPFIPQWIIVYYLAFATWLAGGILILGESKPHGFRFAFAYILNLLISAAFFLAIPCTMTRPEPMGTGLFDLWVRFTYWIDSPTNLFPSLHVSINYLCWRGTIGCRRIPRWYKWFSFVFFVLVCCCVLFVKQHVAADIPSAIIAGEASVQLARLLRLERIGFAAERFLRKKRKEKI